MARDLPLGRIPFGAVYLIDAQLTHAKKRRDLTRMRSLHFNTVLVWPPVSRTLISNLRQNLQNDYRISQSM
jgi:hypothetical protein